MNECLIIQTFLYLDFLFNLNKHGVQYLLPLGNVLILWFLIHDSNLMETIPSLVKYMVC